MAETRIQPTTKDAIIGLLATSRQRGLVGEQAILRWMVAVGEVLLVAELERIEAKDKK